MIEIDGSTGEGGGQVLRTSAALSVVTGEPVRIFNIRANRRKPGLRPQHLMVLKMLKELSGARTSGLEVNSDEVTFEPGELKGGSFCFDIGTAGSITLVFEACILALSGTGEKVSLEVTGGTDVKWSPSWDFFGNVFVPLTARMGLDVKAELITRGHNPEGGGKGRIEVMPSKGLLPLVLDGGDAVNEVKGTVFLSNLPEHIAKRMRSAAVNILMKNGLNASVNIHRTEPVSTGTGITIWSVSDDRVLGAQALGERGVTAEKVAEMTVNELMGDIVSGASIDVHSLDQMIPFMALCPEISSCKVRSISDHSSTNMLVSEFFLGKRFDRSLEGELYRIRSG